MIYGKSTFLLLAYLVILGVSLYSFLGTISSSIQLSKTVYIKTYYNNGTGNGSGVELTGNDIGFCQNQNNCLSLIDTLQSRTQTSQMLSIILIFLAVINIVRLKK